MRSRVVWVGIAIVLIAAVVLVLLLRGSTQSTRAPADATVVVVPPSTSQVTAAPALTDAAVAGAYQTPVARIESEGDPEPIGKGHATLVGRVLGENGKPIPAFGIMIASGNIGYLRIPGHIETTEGRFVVETIQAGTWSVFFAVPGLARKMVAGIQLVDGQTTDIGDVVIDSGLAITGRVLDGSSRPVAGAKVSTSGRGMVITRIGSVEMTDEYRAMRGIHETVTDANGKFALPGAEPGLSLSATHPTLGTSQSVTLPDDDAVIDLVIGPTGTIAGTFEGDHGVVTAMIGDRISKTSRGRDGRFEIGGLVPGAYVVYFRGSSQQPVYTPRAVTIGMNAKETVSFEAPRYVAVEVTGCKLASLGVSGTRMDIVAAGLCRNPTFARVEPGRYSLCQGLSCVDIEVKDAPAHQSFVAPPATP